MSAAGHLKIIGFRLQKNHSCQILITQKQSVSDCTESRYLSMNKNTLTNENTDYEYIDIQELLSHGGKTVYTGSEGRIVVLNDTLLTDIDNSEDMLRIYPQLPVKDIKLACVHNEESARAMVSAGFFSGICRTHQWVYPHSSFPCNEKASNSNENAASASDSCVRKTSASDTNINNQADCIIRTADISELDIISQHSDESLSYLEGRIKSQAMKILYVGNEATGFIGTHEAGSIGLLQGFPAFRRHGYARLLESYMIDQQLRSGHVPFMHIVYENEASAKLQASLGAVKCTRPAIWIFK